MHRRTCGPYNNSCSAAAPGVCGQPSAAHTSICVLQWLLFECDLAVHACVHAPCIVPVAGLIDYSTCRASRMCTGS